MHELPPRVPRENTLCEAIKAVLTKNLRRTVLSEDELRSLADNLEWLKASEKSLEFWNNPEDAVYDMPD